MTELSDRDLILVRLRFLDLLKSFFFDEPDAERMSRWRGIFAALSEEHINPRIDSAINNLGKALQNKDLQELKNEHYALFVDPYSSFLLPLNASYYSDGTSFGPGLVRYRELLKQAQLIKDSQYTAPEDNLLLMLDALISLIEDEKQGSTSARTLQKELLHQFLQPTAKSLTRAAETNSKADFYNDCILFLNGYLELEEHLLPTDETPGQMG